MSPFHKRKQNTIRICNHTDDGRWPIFPLIKKKRKEKAWGCFQFNSIPPVSNATCNNIASGGVREKGILGRWPSIYLYVPQTKPNLLFGEVWLLFTLHSKNYKMSQIKAWKAHLANYNISVACILPLAVWTFLLLLSLIPWTARLICVPEGLSVVTSAFGRSRSCACPGGSREF